jgi:2-haloacid dehalogenase
VRPGANCSPRKGTRPIRAFFFDTYGTVCDFYGPLKAAFARLAAAKGVELDAGGLAIDWRNAYARSTFLHAVSGAPFRPLTSIHRENLVALLAARCPAPVSEAELEDLVGTWNRLEPWPDVVAGLGRLKRLAVIAPLSNGNFDDMVRLARHASLPWDVIVGSSIARAYKPHPDIYLKSVEALGLAPEDVCMVAAHQIDLAYAAGHGMQTAFVTRPLEFGGPTRPRNPEPGADDLGAAEIFPEGDWTYVARDFLDLAAQCEASSGPPGGLSGRAGPL